MKKLLNFFKISTVSLLLVLLFFTTKSFAVSNTFCLENDGFIMPIIDDEKDCKNIINVNEFKQLISLKQDKRLNKLKEIRELVKSQPQKEQSIKSINEEQKKKLFDQVNKKRQIKQARLERLAKFENKKIERQKKFLENKRKLEVKRLEQRKKNEEKRLKRLQELELKKKQKIAKNKERKRLKEIKKQERLAKIAEQQRIKKIKRQEKLVKLEEQKIIREQQKNTKTNKQTASKSISPDKINNEKKVVYINNNIVKGNLFPNITNKNASIEYLQDFNKNKFNELLRFNTNLVLIYPQDYESFSNVISENKMLSKVVTGISQIPNPKINGLESQLRRAEREMIIAQRNIEAGFQQNIGSYDPYGGWASILNQMGGLATQIAAEKQLNQATINYENATRELSNTPMYLEKEILSSYNYNVSNVSAEKKSSYKILRYENKNFFTKDISIKENKNFKLANGINPQDKNYKSLMKKYNTQNDLSIWSDTKLNDISYNKLLAKLNESEYNQINKKEAYSYLNFDYKKKKGSFWKSLFSSGDKKESKKTASLKTNKTNFSISDGRFQSVVVVRTESGLGSGFYISSNEIITNYHVIEKSRNINVIDQNNNRSSAIVLKKDLKRDLALLKTNSNGRPVQFFSGAIKQGSKVEALGHPKGRKFSISQGIVSAIRKEGSVYNATGSDNVLFIQTDAAINKGNSGGPLFLGNKVIGVNTQGLSKQKSEGMNFAVHYSEVLDFLK